LKIAEAAESRFVGLGRLGAYGIAVMLKKLFGGRAGYRAIIIEQFAFRYVPSWRQITPWWD
jgi:hypothetical protein